MQTAILLLQQLQATLWQILAGLVLIWLQKYFDNRH